MTEYRPMTKDERRCLRCGEIYKYTKGHDCKPKAAVSPQPVSPPAPVSKPLVPETVKSITHGPTHHPTHGITHAKKKTELRKAQTYRWRERYSDRWKAYHAEYMRKWRADRTALEASNS